jgi:SNF2 family DNA or RNA helicase
MSWAAIDPAGPHLAIGCETSENHLCQQIPGCNFDKKDSIWRAPLSWGSYVAFKTVWASYPVAEHPKLLDWAASAWQDVQIAYGLRGKMDAGSRVLTEIVLIEHGSVEAGRPLLFPFQRGGVEWLTTQRRVGLTDPQGNGKTPQVIRALQVLNHRAGVSGEPATPALVICTGAALYGWRDELNLWAPELTVRVVTGTALKRRRALVEEGEADVYLISWPNVRMHSRLASYGNLRFTCCPQHGGGDEKITAARCEVHDKELNEIRFMTVVADEAHRMKDASSKQSRAVQYLAHRAPNFWPVTGTPIADTIEDMWPLGHGIDPKSFPAKSRYLDLFAIKEYGWHGGATYLNIRPDTAAAFHAIVQPLVRRIPKELARPQMPPRLPPVFRYPEMDPAQASAYKQLKKELLADLPNGTTVVPANSVTKFTRLCQLAGSSIEMIDGEDAQGFTQQHVELALPSSKVSDLAEFLEDNPGPLVVAANSPRIVELAERKLAAMKITHCKIVGGMHDSDKYQAMRWFQDGQCRVIFITSAGSESITLTAADTIYFLQPDPVFISREQKIGRIDRIGQQSAVRVVYALSRGTVEPGLYKLGDEKESRANAVTMDADLLRWIVAGAEDHDEKEQVRA